MNSRASIACVYCRAMMQQLLRDAVPFAVAGGMLYCTNSVWRLVASRVRRERVRRLTRARLFAVVRP